MKNEGVTVARRTDTSSGNEGFFFSSFRLHPSSFQSPRRLRGDINGAIEHRALGPPGGFSFIEVLVAQALLSIGLLSIAQLFGIAVVHDTYARTQSLAVALAQQRMETLAAQYVAGSRLTSGEDTIRINNLEDARQVLTTFKLVWTVQEAPHGACILQVKIMSSGGSARPASGAQWSRVLVFRSSLAPLRR